MRYKVTIEYIQELDPSDFPGSFKSKLDKRAKLKVIEATLVSSIESEVQDAVDGHGYSLGSLEESLKYAGESDLVRVRAEYIDNRYVDDMTEIWKVLK